MGFRPGMAPLGYFNRAFNGIKDVIIDPDRGPIVTEAFQKVAEHGTSGRTLKKWLVEKGFTNRSGSAVSLSQIYLMLKIHFIMVNLNILLTAEIDIKVLMSL